VTRRPHIRPYPGLRTFDDLYNFVPVEPCAKAMNITPEQVVKLVKSGVLRHTGGFGTMLVEPVCLV